MFPSYFLLILFNNIVNYLPIIIVIVKIKIIVTVEQNTKNIATDSPAYRIFFDCAKYHIKVHNKSNISQMASKPAL